MQDKTRKALKRLILTGVFALLSVLLVLVAKNAGGGFWTVYPAFSRAVTGALAALTAFTRYTVWEILGAAIAVVVLVRLIAGLFKRRFWVRLCGTVLLLSLGVFLYIAIWGLNYYAPSMASRLGLPEELHTPEELADAERAVLEGR